MTRQFDPYLHEARNLLEYEEQSNVINVSDA